jgi:hypothetical protein
MPIRNTEYPTSIKEQTQLLQEIAHVCSSIIDAAHIEESLNDVDILRRQSESSIPFHAAPAVEITKRLQSRLIAAVGANKFGSFEFGFADTRGERFVIEELIEENGKPFIEATIDGVDWTFKDTKIPGIYLQQKSHSNYTFSKIIGKDLLPQQV